MVKIPLEVYDFANGLRPMAHFLLRSDKPHIFAPIKAIVDTGSPKTLIGLSDMKRLRISKVQLNTIEGPLNPIRIGGGSVKTKILPNAKIKFSDLFEIELDVNFPVSGDEQINQPSLLGVDFLEKTGAGFSFNPSKREAYFEIED